MSNDVQSLLQTALELPEQERAWLADSLLKSLNPGDEEDESLQAAWSEEIARRNREFDAGLVKPIPWSQVRIAVRERRSIDG